MPQKLFFAIETLPPSDEVCDEYLQDQSKEPRFRSPFLSRAQAEEHAYQEILDLASTGEYGRLFTLCVLLEFGDGRILRFPLTRNEPESEFDSLGALERFWSMVATLDPSTDLLIGYKIRKEALPFLCKKSAIFRTSPPPHNLCFTDHESKFVCDILEAWNHGSDADMPLPSLAKILSLNSAGDENLLDKKQVYETYRAYMYKEITEQCMRKVDLIRTVYYRLTFQTAPPLPE